MPEPDIMTLGGRLNLAGNAGVRDILGGRDAVVIYSCAATDAAVKQTRGAIRRARAVVERARGPAAAAHCGAVLTGVDLTNCEGGLGALVVHDRLLAIAGEAEGMPHVRPSLRAGRDLALKRMKRRHSRGQAGPLVARGEAASGRVCCGTDPHLVGTPA